MELIQRLFESILGETGVRVHTPRHKKRNKNSYSNKACMVKHYSSVKVNTLPLKMQIKAND